VVPNGVVPNGVVPNRMAPNAVPPKAVPPNGVAQHAMTRNAAPLNTIGLQAGEDTAPMDLTTVSGVPGDQASWLRVLGVVVVAEVTVLWLAAGLGLWRRRVALTRAIGRMSAGARWIHRFLR
jgi:hypothetical protein